MCLTISDLSKLPDILKVYTSKDIPYVKENLYDGLANTNNRFFCGIQCRRLLRT